jgi:RNA polymerase sigma-70 factor (ECF subfamily)
MDIKEFKSLVLPVKEKLYKLAVVLLNSNEEANDALQEVFLRLWEGKHKLSEVNNLEAYAVRMIKNLCLDKIKASKKTSALSSKEYYLEYEDANPYKKYELNDSYNQMQKIMNV